ncbi:MAG: hypothetical protein IPG67_00860 [Acidobacteria bacterium]|nr:hypothetical protein [Acidobacteriota bacterium]
MGESERIERLVVTPQPREFPQSAGTNFMMTAFLCWWQISWIHGFGSYSALRV